MAQTVTAASYIFSSCGAVPVSFEFYSQIVIYHRSEADRVTAVFPAHLIHRKLHLFAAVLFAYICAE